MVLAGAGSCPMIEFGVSWQYSYDTTHFSPAMKIHLRRGALSPFPIGGSLASPAPSDPLRTRPPAPAVAEQPCAPTAPTAAPRSVLSAPCPAGRSNPPPTPGRSSDPSARGG